MTMSFPSKYRYGKSKFFSERVTTDAGTFDSMREARRFYELQLLERAGEISDLKRQVAFELIPAQRDEGGKLLERSVRYIADFTYTDKDGSYVVEDAKGFRTETYILKKKMMLFFHGIRIREV